MIITRSPIQSFLSFFLKIHPHEIYTVFYSTSSFFFVLSAYFVVLPLRDEGAISLGIGNLPGLFAGSLILTLIAAPLSTLIFSLPNLPKPKALVLMHRFFSASLVLFFILWVLSSPANTFPGFKGFLSMSSTIKEELKIETQPASTNSTDWGKHGWFYVSVRIGFFLWIALLNLITISSTWARVIDVMDNESGSRLFGFIGAGATFGQLFGSLFATGMAWLGPYLLLFASLLMELAAQSSKGINKDIANPSEELIPLGKTEVDQQDVINEVDVSDRQESLPTAKSSAIDSSKPQFWALLDGFWLIWSSNYLLCVSLFLWLSAMTSSFFYFQKVTVIASTVTTATGRRRLFAQINSFIAVFILAGQLTLTGRILTVAGVTIALCAAPFTAFLNLIAIAVWPTYLAIAVSETLRKVVTYVVTRPGRELLFTVVTQDEKYKAKVCIDVLVQRFGDATAAGMYKLLHTKLDGKTTHISLYALPVCVLWVFIGFHLGRRQAQLAKSQNLSFS
ncbi:uncharacterized protein LOC112510408 isoform X1 [Cynara cardunculus var. scolymus]|uniref:uncharacterized protein LOC112510408 isoform X1 n=2 Tax=Cynara cardunculus var. scolymus TaxID=59895 RepID=UPI000D6260A3|nr:uncharacterized protein LOC112510408 isoform X1 [Cynara cardunculus var. scolymus]